MITMIYSRETHTLQICSPCVPIRFQLTTSNLQCHLLFIPLPTLDIFYGMFSVQHDSRFFQEFPTPSQGLEVKPR